MTDQQQRPTLLDDDELLGHFLAATGAVRHGQDQLRRHLDRLAEPAQLTTIVLTPQRTVVEDTSESASLSIGLLNPENVRVALGVSGASATIAGRAITVPANALLVLPVAASQIEIAADPADIGADNLVVFLLRFKHVQAAFLGKGA